jgi:Zn-dependent peptidase ImmA (M78 family)
LLDSLVAGIESYVEMPDVSFPDIAASSAGEIELAAEQSRQYWGLGLTAPILSMMRVVENAGAVVTYFGDLSKRVDAFSMDRRRPIIVRSSLKESLCRQRFDLAHEVGHLIMHRGLQTGDRLTEDQAHRFAGAFLFPAGAFLREFPRGRTIDWIALYKLKLRWKMSVRAMIRRAYDLGMLSPAQYRTANIHMVKSGQAQVERYDNDGSLPVEEPELLPSAINYLNTHIIGGLPTIGEQLGLTRTMVELVTGFEMPPESPVFDDPKVVKFTKR